MPLDVGTLGLGVAPYVVRVTALDQGTFGDYSVLGVLIASGNLSSWTPSTVVLPSATMRGAAAGGQVSQAARYLYAIGGDSGGASPTRNNFTMVGTLNKYGNLGAWKRACDLWCAAWMPGAPPRQLYHAMLDLCLGRASHARDIERWRDRTLAVAADVGCFHWPLEFPEVFLDAGGRPSPSGGFDAVIGNPPWEMLRGDRARETSARAEGAALVAFARKAGVYRSQGGGHANQCQLFVERAFQLARPGGRIGLVLPASLLSAEGSARLRRSLMLSHRLESITVFDNRRALFPIHRSYRFATLTAARSEPYASSSFPLNRSFDPRTSESPRNPFTIGTDGCCRPRQNVTNLEIGNPSGVKWWTSS